MSLLSCNEIIGTSVCEEVYLNSIELFKKATEPWYVCCRDGGVIQNFGKEVDKLVESIVDNFEKSLIEFKETKIYLQKKDMLIDNIVFELQYIFEKQLLRIKEISFQNFKEALSPIQITQRVEKDIQVVINAMNNYFVEIVDTLLPKKAKGLWFFDKEHLELLHGMREISIERLQMAKLQGIYLQKSKNPINLSFHYLHPHPFGKDLRFDHMSIGDTFNFNSKNNQKASLMRQGISTKGKSLKVTPIDQEEQKIYNDLVYHDNPASAFQGSR